MNTKDTLIPRELTQGDWYL